MVVSLNYCSQNGGNLYRAPYYNGHPNIGPRIIGNLDQSPYRDRYAFNLGLEAHALGYRLGSLGFGVWGFGCRVAGSSFGVELS